LCARRLLDSSELLLRAAFAQAALPNVDLGADLGRSTVMRITGPLVDCLLPLVGALALGAVIAALLQGGGRWTKERAASRKAESWCGSLLAVAVCLVTLLVGVRQLAAALPSLLGSLATDPLTSRGAALTSLERTLSVGYGQASILLGVLAAIALAAGALDAVLERSAWRRRHAMAPEEERRERRAQEVAPEVRAARHRAHRNVVRPRATHGRPTS
jgi:uncharacterized protein (DUF2062 family)